MASQPISIGGMSSELTATADLTTALLTMPDVDSYISINQPAYSFSDTINQLGAFSKEAMIETGGAEKKAARMIWFVRGLQILPTTITAVTGSGLGEAIFQVSTSTKCANPSDIITIAPTLQQLYVRDEPTLNGDGTYTQNVQLFGSDPNDSVSQSVVGASANRTGNAFAEGSSKSYGFHRQPDAYDNYTTINRHEASITRGADTQMLWVSDIYGNKSYWPSVVAEGVDYMRYTREINYIFGRRTVQNINGNFNTLASYIKDVENSRDVYGMDGYIAAVPSANFYTISNPSQITESWLTSIALSMRSNGSYSNDTKIELTVICGDGFYAAATSALKLYYVSSGSFVQLAEKGATVQLGQSFEEYKVGNSVSLKFVRNSILSHPSLGGGIMVNNWPKLSYTALFADFTVQANGERNISVHNRLGAGLIMKELSGMINKTDPGSKQAATKFDGTTFLWEQEYTTKMALPNRCGLAMMF